MEFDVVIAGGGLSGALTALSLADLSHNSGKHLSIAIVEANAIHQNPALTYDDRVLALAHGSASYLNQLQVWPLLKEAATGIKNIHVSDRGYYGKARLKASDYQVSSLGYVIELALIGQALLKVLASKSNVTWFCPDSISKINWQKNHLNVQLASKQTLKARLLLACDGANSPCREMAKIKCSSHEYQQHAVIANVSTEKPHLGKAFERFTEFGPIAMLPLSQNRCSLVWTLPPEKAAQTCALTDEQFKTELQQAFGYWLGEITQVGKRNSFPLTLVQAESNIAPRLALVGNASHTIHPIAGQGFNLGLRDVKQLASLIKHALATEQDIGEYALLMAYQQHRQVDQQQIIQLTDSLVTFFSNQLPPMVLGRNIGLKVLNYFSPLKKALATKTMGY
jgi:2-octaprenyl-6-methoxyphenol hydroxylase